MRLQGCYTLLSLSDSLTHWLTDLHNWRSYTFSTLQEIIFHVLAAVKWLLKEAGAVSGWTDNNHTHCCTALHYSVLYCTALCCTILYCTVLYCTVLYCTVLNGTSIVLSSYNLSSLRLPTLPSLSSFHSSTTLTYSNTHTDNIQAYNTFFCFITALIHTLALFLSFI